jgi:predicted ATPase
MARRRLRSLTIEGLTSIRSATVELGDVNVLIGPNGAGKSNFVSALALLGRMADGRLNFHVARAGGASNLLHKGVEAANQIRLHPSFGDLRYEAELVPAANDALAVNGEVLVARPSESDGAPVAFTVTGGGSESALSKIGSGEQRASGEFQGVAEAVLEQVQGCRVFHFHDTGMTSPMKSHGYAADNLTLHADAGNIAAVLLRLKQSEPGTYRQILRSVRTIAPFFREFVLVEQDERIQLRWSQEGSEGVLPPSALSDGTLRFICLVTLLHLPEPPSIVVLDEPELGLHPHAIVHLAEMLYASSHRTQVILATQSVTLIDQFDPADLIIVERQNGASTFNRARPEELRIWLEDYSMGELWQKNLIGGNPRRERGGA